MAKHQTRLFPLLGTLILGLGMPLLGQSAVMADDKPLRVEGAGLEAARTSFFGNRFINKGAGLVPPGELTEGGSRDGFVVLAQSKKQLGQGIAQNTIRVDQLEQQVRQMNGRIEELVFQIQQLQQQIRLMQEDNEFRFQELEGGKRSDLGTSNETQTAGVTPQSEQNLLPPADPLGDAIEQASPDAENAPLDIAAALKQNADNLDAEDGVNGNLQSGDPLLQPDGVASLGTLTVEPDSDPEALYNLGYSQLLNGNYAGSEENLRAFLQRYGSHPLAPNASYWLAETYFARGQYDTAVQEFSNTYKSYPQGEKAPDSLLKLGLSLAELNELDAACATLSEMLNRFPNAPRSVQLLAQDKRAETNCS